jgi:hypothetical protein
MKEKKNGKCGDFHHLCKGLTVYYEKIVEYMGTKISLSVTDYT